MWHEPDQPPAWSSKCVGGGPVSVEWWSVRDRVAAFQTLQPLERYGMGLRQRLWGIGFYD